MFSLVKNTLLLIGCTAALATAQFDYGFDFSKAGSAGLQFLKIGVGARSSAMGEAAVSTATDAEAVFWNSAGLALVQKRQISLSQTNWLVNSRHFAGVLAWPLGSYVLAVNAVTLAIDEFEETTVLKPDGTGRMVSAQDMVIGLAVAKRFTNKLSIGGQVKFVQEKLDDYTVDNILFDIGTLYYTGFRQLRLGFSLQHFGPDMKIAEQSYRTPLIFRVSAADEAVNLESMKLTTTLDVVHPTDNKEWLNVGAELTFLNMLAIRGGYRLNQDEGRFTAGVGFQWLERTFADLKIDYAYSSFGDIFGEVHRFSVGLGF